MSGKYIKEDVRHIHDGRLNPQQRTYETLQESRLNDSALRLIEKPFRLDRIPRPRGRLAEGPKAGYVLCPASANVSSLSDLSISFEVETAKAVRTRWQ